jgi:hypothetical protein
MTREKTPNDRDTYEVDPYCLFRLVEGGAEVSEGTSQRIVVEALRRAGVAVFAVPNGGSRGGGAREGATLAGQGVSAGVPDLILPVPSPGRKMGLALEMKRGNGSPRDVSASQWEWLEWLHLAGWGTAVGYGHADALAKLRAYGYLPKGPLTRRHGARYFDHGAKGAEVP